VANGGTQQVGYLEASVDDEETLGVVVGDVGVDVVTKT
jgi:hypothetical protein